ncbi:hypothetical protein [Rhodopseudomonas sp. AAP120]|uniref:hypothetical protein n=1 Tax=Rhodopseudomonas sp. AAP120 TaxID=1523430 RepID=UPI0012E110DC|nr:hypothetical protein [Rhodopseudomonas sp. AAP120]
MPSIALQIIGNEAQATCDRLKGSEGERAQRILDLIKESRAIAAISSAQNASLERVAADALTSAARECPEYFKKLIEEATSLEIANQTQQSDLLTTTVNAAPYIFGLIICLRIRAIKLGPVEIKFFEGLPPEIPNFVSALLKSETESIDTVIDHLPPSE